LLSPVLYLLIFLRKLSSGKKPLRILVIQGAKIGDLICTTPIFREIKRKFPDSYLSVMVISKTKDILRNNPRLDEILIIDDYQGISGKMKLLSKLRREKYDWVFSLLPDSFDNLIGLWSLIPNRVVTTYKQSGEITKLLSVFSNKRLEYKRHLSLLRHYFNLLKFVGIKETSEEKEIFIKPAEEEKAANFLKSHNLNENDLLVGISIKAGIDLKEWEQDKFVQLADRLAEELNAKIIFIGGPADSSLIEEAQRKMKNTSISAANNFRLYETPALMKKLKLFISVDTGPLYIADTVGTPVVSISGPCDAREQSPSGKKVIIIQKKINCVPCSFVIIGARKCKEGHLRCLRETTPEEVFKAAKELIKS